MLFTVLREAKLVPKMTLRAQHYTTSRSPVVVTTRHERPGHVWPVGAKKAAVKRNVQSYRSEQETFRATRRKSTIQTQQEHDDRKRKTNMHACVISLSQRHLKTPHPCVIVYIYIYIYMCRYIYIYIYI